MVVSVEGNRTEVSAVYLPFWLAHWKAASPIEVTLVPDKSTNGSLWPVAASLPGALKWNAWLPMVRRVAGKVTDVRSLQSSKADWPMAVAAEGRITVATSLSSKA